MICTGRTGTLEDIPAAVAQLEPEARRKRGRKKKDDRQYTEQCLAFDIEVSSIPWLKAGLIYHWQLQIGEHITITGRYGDDIPQAFALVNAALEDKGLHAVCWIHNAAYEFQFLRSLCPEIRSVFAVDVRTPLKFDIGSRVECRCSYLQSGESLLKLTKDYQVFHTKAAGDLDYHVVRYPWTPLSDVELGYCLNDVRGLVEAMQARRDERLDTWTSMPLTKTGYVRRRVKQALTRLKPWAKDIQQDYQVYQALRRAFRGGNTHANRVYSGEIVGPCYEWDRSSSYPDVIVNCRFPQGRFSRGQPERFMDFYRSGEYAIIADIAILDLELQDPLWPVPYLSIDKCRSVSKPLRDNGRIISAEYLETTVTDIDLDILMSEYHGRIRVQRFWYSRYKKLPPELTDIVIDLYHKKTSLKGVAGREADYSASKGDINSCYGMMVQDPGKPDIIYEDGDWKFSEIELDSQYRQHIANTPLLYCWGVWVAAWARYRLEEAIRAAGTDFVYCDTDSVYSLSPIDLDDFNAERVRQSTETGAHATDPKGHEHYMGVFEQEGGEIQEFLTWGAKKYAFVADGELRITIAGVHKKKGAAELAAAGGLPALRPGFTFRDAGGTQSLYVDEPVGWVTLDGRQVYIGTCIYMEDSTYTLGITEEYMQLLSLTKEQTYKLFYLMKTQEEI